MRERFLALDGLRGAAAFAVLLYHLRGRFGDLGLFGHGYLAVDFFFLLSGFVIAHAYEGRLAAGGAIAGFVRDRVIRLYPLLWLSLAPGAVAVAAGAFDPFARPAAAVAAAFLPFPAWWEGSWYRPHFALNPMAWSLFWELVANLAFAAIAPRLGIRLLVAIVLVLVAACMAGSLAYSGLWRVTELGALRAGASFALGVLLLRLHREQWFELAGWGRWAMPLLIAALALPALPAASGLLDIAIVFGLFPVLLLGAAGREARLASACAWLGGLSYPLYILQAPVLRWSRETMAALGIWFPTPLDGLFRLSLCVAAAWIAWRWYDEPVRRWLRRRFGSLAHRRGEADVSP